MANFRKMYPSAYYPYMPMYSPGYWNYFPNQHIPYKDQAGALIKLMDYGPHPFAINIEEATKENNNFRIALWTGNHLQLTLMSINVGEDIGLEMHPNLDQFIRIEEGIGLIQMGDRKDRLDCQAHVQDDYAIIIPAGKWHNLMNIGNIPLKLYSIYAPPEHPFGTVHRTKEEAEEHHRCK